jgi:hypothetical protein
MILFHTSTPGSEPDSGNDKIVITPDGRVGRRYRTFAGPHFWTIGGLSSGGWGPLNSGLRHLDPFRIFFSQIGFLQSPWPPEQPPGVHRRDPAGARKTLRFSLDAGLNDLSGADYGWIDHHHHAFDSLSYGCQNLKEPLADADTWFLGVRITAALVAVMGGDQSVFRRDT